MVVRVPPLIKDGIGSVSNYLPCGCIARVMSANFGWRFFSTGGRCGSKWWCSTWNVVLVVCWLLLTWTLMVTVTTNVSYL